MTSSVPRAGGALLIASVLALSGCAVQPTERVAVVTDANPAADVIALAEGVGDDATRAAVDSAVAQIPAIVERALSNSGVPGAAVAVTFGEETIFSDGFGVKREGDVDAVDAETVFQVASVSKPISATAVAKAVSDGVVGWDTHVVDELPDFALSDAYVTEHATIADYFSHRSGLATGAGDDLEDLGYDRAYILDHLDRQPLAPFRATYQYSNFGITVGAEAVAAAIGMPWSDVVDTLVYEPLGMTSSHSTYEGFLSEDNRATLHAYIDGAFEPLFERDADAQTPAGGVSSTVLDLAAWMRLVLSGGQIDGVEYIASDVLGQATTGKIVSSASTDPLARPGMYGYGFDVSAAADGRTVLAHSGGFVKGAGTNVRMIPSLGLGIVTLTNGAPVGVAEAINATFADLVLYGEPSRDWVSAYETVMVPYHAPAGDLAGERRPADAAAPAEPGAYVGTYTNDYFGDLIVSELDGGLVAALGADGAYGIRLSPWNGDGFAFVPHGENAPAGSLSSAQFVRAGDEVNGLVLDFFDAQGLGTWHRETGRGGVD